jgi:WD40 repeat protein
MHNNDSLRSLHLVSNGSDILVATSGSECCINTVDAAGRRIIIWSLRQNRIIAHLSAGTKTITYLNFLNEDKGSPFLISADLDYDLHLWHWPSSTRIYSWRKAHGRIIHSVLGVPSRSPMTLASCSSDHSIRLWSTSSTEPINRVHSNAPFLGICFVGNSIEVGRFLITALPICKCAAYRALL